MHVLLRYSDKLAPREGTISAHSKLIKAYGYVWVGKFGSPIAQRTVDILNQQIKNNIPSYLFLVQKFGEGYRVTAGELSGASTSLAPAESDKVPKYYQLDRNIGGWFKVEQFYTLESSILEKLVLAKNSIPAMTSLHRTMAGFFIVHLEATDLTAEFDMKPI